MISRAQLAPDRLPRLFDRTRQLYVYKGGFGAEACADIAAVLAGLPSQQRHRLSEFGRWFGVAFQIMDDVRNFSSDPEWTKTCGEDLASGKPTYVILKAVQGLRGRTRARLVEILCTAGLRTDPVVLEEGITLVRASGALAASRCDAHRMFERAWQDCAGTLPASEARVLLYAFCSRLLRVLHET
jgi:octaprenyl-diphosphate synthase